MDMAAVALALVVFGHEGDALALGVGDLFGTALIDGVVVAGGQGRGVAKPDLLLTEVALTLDALAIHSGAVHGQTDLPQQRLHSSGCLQRVVDVVIAGRGQASIALLPGSAVAIVEHDEFQLGRAKGEEAVCGQSVELPAQNLPRRGDHGGVVWPVQVGGDQGGSGQPRSQTEGVKVGPHRHIAVAAAPARHGVTLDRVHLHVDGEQIVAALSTVRRGILQEQPC